MPRPAKRRLLLQLVIVGLVEERRVRVEARHHALDRGRQQLLVVDRFDILALDLSEDFREQAELVEGSGAVAVCSADAETCSVANTPVARPAAIRPMFFNFIRIEIWCGREARGGSGDDVADKYNCSSDNSVERRESVEKGPVRRASPRTAGSKADSTAPAPRRFARAQGKELGRGAGRAGRGSPGRRASARLPCFATAACACAIASWSPR